MEEEVLAPLAADLTEVAEAYLDEGEVFVGFGLPYPAEFSDVLHDGFVGRGGVAKPIVIGVSDSENALHHRRGQSVLFHLFF